MPIQIHDGAPLVPKLTARRSAPLPYTLDRFTLSPAADKPLDRKTLQAAVGIQAPNHGQPPQGTMQGTVNGAPLDLTVNRRQSTIRGTVNQAEVAVDIDHDARHIGGTANGGKVDAEFTWNPEGFVMNGTADGNALQETIDWRQGNMRGSCCGQPIDVQFDLQQGTAQGSAFGQALQLQLDGPSGALTGSLNGADVNATLVNSDLSDFLQNLYLFAPPGNKG